MYGGKSDTTCSTVLMIIRKCAGEFMKIGNVVERYQEKTKQGICYHD
jgi:hypothetical protein